MRYDIATLTLWITVGVTVIIGAIQVAGWRHRTLVVGLILVGATMIIAVLAAPFYSLAANSQAL